MDRQHQPCCLFDPLLRLGSLSEGFWTLFPAEMFAGMCRAGVSGSWNALCAGEEQIAPTARGLRVDPTSPISWRGCGEPGV